jgi:hypothetical protein
MGLIDIRFYSRKTRLYLGGVFRRGPDSRPALLQSAQVEACALAVPDPAILIVVNEVYALIAYKTWS